MINGFATKGTKITTKNLITGLKIILSLIILSNPRAHRLCFLVPFVARKTRTAFVFSVPFVAKKTRPALTETHMEEKSMTGIIGVWMSSIAVGMAVVNLRLNRVAIGAVAVAMAAAGLLLITNQ